MFTRAFVASTLLVLLTGLLGPIASAAAAGTDSSPGVRLPGHVLQVLPKATKLPPSAQGDAQPVTLTVMLNRDDQAGFDALVTSIADPASPNYRHYVSQADLTARFGPSQQTYDAVLAHLQKNGFNLVEGSANRLTITVQGTRAQAKQAFAVGVDDYQVDGRTFFANDSDPVLPATLQPHVRGISGFANLAQPKPALNPSPAQPTSIATAYDAGGLRPGANGAGWTIGLVEFDNFSFSDVSNWLSFAGLPASLINNLHVVDVDGGVVASGGIGTTEVLGDIDAVLGFAQGANVVVADAPSKASWTDVYNALLGSVAGGTQGLISTSWDSCEYDMSASEAQSIDSLFQQAAASGIFFFTASGDYGGVCIDPNGTYGSNVPAAPADAPHGTAVGGTVLQVGAGNTYQSESWWGSGCPFGGKCASGFGVSVYFTRPAYQNGFTSASGRSTPDVVAESAPGITICQTTCNVGFGGTSLATPLLAAGIAVADSEFNNDGYLGNHDWSPARLYGLANTPAFHSAASIGSDFAHVGLGSFDLSQLVAQVDGVPQVTGLYPRNGLSTGGTSVQISGSSLWEVKSVRFGSTPATSFTITSDGIIQAVSPPGGGTVDVTVSSLAGTSTTSVHDWFSYEGPWVTSVSPVSGHAGDSVTINGFGLSYAPGSTSISFGSAQVGISSFGCYPGPSCVATVPPGVVGTVDVRVTVNGVESPVVPGDRFSYAAPTVTSIIPASGPQIGGTLVEIQGTDFDPQAGTDHNMQVYFGGVPGTNLLCISGTWCNVTSPAGSGYVDVTVKVGGVSSAPTPSDVFHYEPIPTVTGISPTNGLATGGTKVTIHGTNFSTALGATRISFGPNAASDVTCTTPALCFATSPAGAGNVDLTATVGSLVSKTSSADQFTYIPIVTGISPAGGPQTGGTQVTITGFGFDRPGFMFGSNGSFSVNCSSATTCVTTTPANTGTVDVRAIFDGQMSAITTADQFTYQPTTPAGWARWYLDGNHPLIQPLLSGALTYDTVRGVVLDAGTLLVSDGQSVNGSSTWTWNGGASPWAQASPTTSPQARRFASLAFDQAAGTAVLFGGVREIVSATGIPSFRISNDTWTWNGSAWTQQFPASSPSARQGASIAYDAAHKQVVLFGGGPGILGTYNDTWTWNGTTWSLQTPATSPPARQEASMAYDATHGTVVLFGGVDGSDNALSDTWLWNGTTWTQQFPTTSPPARQGAGMANHPASGGVLLFGGSGAKGADTWGWNGTTWTQLTSTTSPSASPASGTSSMDYDAATNLVVMLAADGTTWTWGGN